MILAIHTAGMESILQLMGADGSIVATDKWASGRTLSDDLLSHIVHLVEANSADIQSLTGIIIFSGPGSFTSLRIGHTVANALADGLSIPVVGALDENWIEEGIIDFKTSGTKEPALPFYGSEPNITKPKH